MHYVRTVQPEELQASMVITNYDYNVAVTGYKLGMSCSDYGKSIILRRVRLMT
jgi:hypothetical protein